MESLKDILSRITNYMPWRNEADFDNAMQTIEKVEGEIVAKIEEVARNVFSTQQPGVTTVSDSNRAVVVDDAPADPAKTDD